MLRITITIDDENGKRLHTIMPLEAMGTTYGHIKSNARSCAGFIRDGLRQGIPDSSIYEQAKARYPHLRVRPYYPQWYRNQMKRNGTWEQ